MPAPNNSIVIGHFIPSLNSWYAGIAGDLEGGAEPGHLVLLAKKWGQRADWRTAKKLAKALGQGARLPTQAEGILLYANLKAQFEARWHWLGTQYSDSIACFQYFENGYQSHDIKSYEGFFRAVRRFPLQSFSPLDVGAEVAA